jgi:hypothetical protein
MMGEVEGGDLCPVLVTNKHVVAGAARLNAHFVGKKADVDEPNLGSEVTVTLPADSWVGHPSENVDIAVIPLGPGWGTLTQHCFTRALPMSLLATDVAGFDSDAIEEITFVGYPSGLRDPKHFTPIARRGITATPLDMDMGGEPVFWIDGSVFGGSSGSPVFMLKEGMYRVRDGMQFGTRFAVVGIVAATMTRQSEFPLHVASAPHIKIAQELNLGVAFNAQAIREAIAALIASGGRKIKPVPSKTADQAEPARLAGPHLAVAPAEEVVRPDLPAPHVPQ